jgi:hypothetical protein
MLREGNILSPSSFSLHIFFTSAIPTKSLGAKRNYSFRKEFTHRSSLEHKLLTFEHWVFSKKKYEFVKVSNFIMRIEENGHIFHWSLSLTCYFTAIVYT